MPKTRTLMAALAAALSIPATASAQLITWGPVVPSIAPADVRLNGTLVVARNIHAASATVSPMVNGVLFQGALAPIGWNGAIPNDGLNGSTTGDAGYDDLLRQARATSGPAGSPTGWGAIQLDTLGTLTVGRSYEIQCWYTDQRTGSATNVLYDRQMTLSSVVGAATLSQGEITNLGVLTQGPNSGLLDADPDDAPAINTPDVLFGSHCTGTFTRTSNDPMYLLVQGSHPLGNNLKPHLTAFQIRELGGAWTTYGAGCAGAAGAASLQLVSAPAIGGSYAMDVTPVGAGAVFMITGLGQLNVPVAFSPFAPGCTALASTELAQFVPTAAPGTASWSLSIPNQPSLAGFQLFSQAIELDAVWSLSNGAAATL